MNYCNSHHCEDKKCNNNNKQTKHNKHQNSELLSLDAQKQPTIIQINKSVTDYTRNPTFIYTDGEKMSYI